jgi:hypothetical protein
MTFAPVPSPGPVLVGPHEQEREARLLGTQDLVEGALEWLSTVEPVMVIGDVWMSRFKAAPTWTEVGWGLGIALSGAAVVRAVRPERSTVAIAITAATPGYLCRPGHCWPGPC